MDDNPYLLETVYYRRAQSLIGEKWREGYEVAHMTMGHDHMLVLLFQRRLELNFA